MSSLPLPPRGTLAGVWDAETKAWFEQWMQTWQTNESSATNLQIGDYLRHKYLAYVASFHAWSRRSNYGKSFSPDPSEFLPAAETVYDLLLDHNPGIRDEAGQGELSLRPFLDLVRHRRMLGPYQVLDYILSAHPWEAEDWNPDMWEAANSVGDPGHFLPLLASNPHIPDSHLDYLVDQYAKIVDARHLSLSVARLAGLAINPALSAQHKWKLSGHLDRWLKDENFKKNHKQRYEVAEIYGVLLNFLIADETGENKPSVCHDSITCERNWAIPLELLTNALSTVWTVEEASPSLQLLYTLFTCPHLSDDRGLRTKAVESVLERFEADERVINPSALVFLVSPALSHQKKLESLMAEMDASVPQEWVNLLI